MRPLLELNESLLCVSTIGHFSVLRQVSRSLSLDGKQRHCDAFEVGIKVMLDGYIVCDKILKWFHSVW